MTAFYFFGDNKEWPTYDFRVSLSEIQTRVVVVVFSAIQIQSDVGGTRVVVVPAAIGGACVVVPAAIGGAYVIVSAVDDGIVGACVAVSAVELGNDSTPFEAERMEKKMNQWK